MKRTSPLMLAVLLLGAADPVQARTWTSASGSTVEAELVSAAGGMVTLKKTDGTMLRIRFNQLSAEDQRFIRQEQMPAIAGRSGSARSITSGDTMELLGVKLEPGQRNYFEVPLTPEQQNDAGSGKNPKPDRTKSVIALPPGFNPVAANRILVINQTSDGDGSSVNHLNEYWETVIGKGWIALAADGPLQPPDDNNAWRWTMIKATLDALHAIWPQSRAWPVATGGFSGGAKRAGYMAGALADADYRVIGMFMGGCNQDMATRGLDTFKPNRGNFLKVPIFLSNGTGDEVASVEKGERVRDRMSGTGFKYIRLETYDGGHWLSRPHVADALDWFDELAKP